MDEDDYFNGEDYVTLDGGINDNNDYPSSNDNVVMEIITKNI